MTLRSLTCTSGRRRHALPWSVCLLLIGLLAGCSSITLPMPEDDMVAASPEQVRAAAWEHVQETVRELGQLDETKHPGIAALVDDLRAVSNQVGQGEGGNLDVIDPKKLLAENPDYWRAMLEMDPEDSTLAALEVLVKAAAGELQSAGDLLEIVRAGPLMDEELDARLAHVRRLIETWRLNPPGIDIGLMSGLPPADRWEPAKRLEAEYPDSPAVALAVLRMRADLADIELVPEDGEDQRMRDKILAAEPRAIKTLEEHQPLWAAVLKATGEKGDAAKRVAEMLTPDPMGLVNFSADDLAQLVSDLDRIGLPDWALRVLRLHMGARGAADDADFAAWRALLPGIIGDAAANELIDAWEQGRLNHVTIRPKLEEPEGDVDHPIAPVVGGHFVRQRRYAEAIANPEHAPTPHEERGAWLEIAENERMLGNLAEAEAALMRWDGKDQLPLEQQRLLLAQSRGDRVGVEAALSAVRKLDRKLRATHFAVGNGEVLLGNWSAAAQAFSQGYKNERGGDERRAFAALHAYGAGVLAGEDLSKQVTAARALVDEDEWVARLLGVVLGDVTRDQILTEADEGRDYIKIGQRCEALFALAFAPGQTAAGRRANLEACVETGMASYIEYEFALAWLRHHGWWPR